MSVQQAVATGFLIFRRMQNNIEYLLLQCAHGKHWSPPKGHVDPGESEIETAWRETQEEAGYTKNDLMKIDGFQKTLQYEAWGKPKTVEYWLAELMTPERPVILSHEHITYKWLGITEAVECAGFADLQETLREADKFISKSLEKSEL